MAGTAEVESPRGSFWLGTLAHWHVLYHNFNHLPLSNHVESTVKQSDVVWVLQGRSIVVSIVVRALRAGPLRAWAQLLRRFLTLSR